MTRSADLNTKPETAVILGGTGFVGSLLATRLTQLGYEVVVPTRHRSRHRALGVNPHIRLVASDIHDTQQLESLFKDCSLVINMVGILNESGKSNGFERVHVELPEKVCQAMQAAGVNRLLHMSALNADAGEKNSRYLQSRGRGEDIAHAGATNGLLVTSFRPSVIFGPGDSFFNRFAGLLRISPLLFPLACPNSRFSPVYVGNVVDAFCRCIGPATAGERLDLCGPRQYSLKNLVEYTRVLIGARCMIIGLGNTSSYLQALVLGLLPGKPFTVDNYHSLQIDSTCIANALPALGISPTTIEAVVPGYLADKNARGRYTGMRKTARRG